MKTLLNIIAVVFVLALTDFAFAQNNTADYWQCESRQGGSWTVGRASSICLVRPFQQPSEVTSYWSSITYDDVKYNSSTSVRDQENKRYATEMNALVSGFADKYYLKRKPTASSQEVQAWLKAILAVSYHESIWTHYRKGTDNQMRMLRGDYGHGHGLMQVDDRWHFAYVREGGAARIQDNIIYGLDLFYSLWTKAGQASCVGGASNYLSRTRATYSMYNGGEGSVCRWTNPSHTWYKNDKNFYDHFVQENWKRFVVNQPTFKYNFSCLVQGGGLSCFDSEEPQPPVTPNPPTPIYALSVEELYNLKSKNLNCTWNNSFLSCLPSALGTQCLKDLFGISADKQLIDLESKTSQSVTTRMINPDLKCAPTGAVAIGDFIQTQVAINLRKTPGGNLITTVPAKQSYQVLDIYKNEMTKISYYLISSSKGVGYIYTGTDSNSSNYTKKVFSNGLKKIIASEGDVLNIKNSAGINMRSTPGGTFQINMPISERPVVLERLIRTDERHVYYKVQYKGLTGYIYSGRLAPSPNVNVWTEVK